LVIDRPGGFDRLRIEEAPDPRPGPGEVLIEVEASGVNFADCIIRMGLYASAREFVGYPVTPGFETAGRVLAVGPGVAQVQKDADVIAVTRFGGHASRVLVPARQVFPRPAALTSAQAAAFPTAFLTAWFALFELAHPRKGSSILVHSAAGGVGSALVQLGKLAGCRVIGVVGAPHKVDAVRELGADVVIDKSGENLWPAAYRASPPGYDVVLDANGASTLRESYRHLAPVGKLVLYGFHSMFPKRGGKPAWWRMVRDYLRTPRFSPFELTRKNRSILAFNLSYLFDRADILQDAMTELLGWLDTGRIRMPLVIPYPAERAADAQRDLETGQTVGKLVLTWNAGSR